MKIKNIAKVSIIFLYSAITYTHATPVSVTTTSFLPYSIEAVYLDRYAFPLVNINVQDIPQGKYEIKFKSYRDQKMIATKQYINVAPLITEQQLSLVILPDESVINTTAHQAPNSDAMFPWNKYKQLAHDKFTFLQKTLLTRDKIGVILPDIDNENITELEQNFQWVSTINAQPSSCTGTFKMQPNDSLPYFTSANHNIMFTYSQKGRQLKVQFDRQINDNTTPVIDRKITHLSNFYNGVQFKLEIIPIKKLPEQYLPNLAFLEDKTKLSIQNYKVKAKLYLKTQNTKELLIMNHDLHFQEFCAFKTNSLLYYKNFWTRFFEMLTPNISWK